MSIKSWKEKYYPIPANQVEKKDAVQHSLLKWEGLQSDVLIEYGLNRSAEIYQIEDFEGATFEVTADTCALCLLYYDEEKEHEGPPKLMCEKCPIYEEQGCSCTSPTGDGPSQWGAWIRGDARPMLEILQQVKERENET